MKYVKLIALPDTWFKAGTEVYQYDCNPPNLCRISLDEWEIAIKEQGVNARGIRVCEDNPNENGLGYKAGDERWDGEWCGTDEFSSEIVEESK